jgi:cell division protein ZapB
MAEAKFRALSGKIDLLIKHCEQLEHDNAALRDIQNNWNQERSQLLQKNDLARNKIEAMIGRLKALEQH